MNHTYEVFKFDPVNGYKRNMKHKRVLFAGPPFFSLMTGLAEAHCEIPCGIYDDEAGIKQLLEHVTTIEMSMNQIVMCAGW